MEKLVIKRIIQLAGIILLISAALMLRSAGGGLTDHFGMGYGRSAAVMKGDISTETAVTTLGGFSTFVSLVFGIGTGAAAFGLIILFVLGIIRDIPVYRKYFEGEKKNDEEN